MDALKTRNLDVREFRKADRRRKSFVYLVLVVIVGVAVMMTVVVVPRVAIIEQRGLTTAAGQILLVVLGVGMLIVAAGSMSVPAYFSGAIYLSVTSRGIRIEYPRGRHHELSWTDHRTRLALYDFSAFPRMVRQSQAYHLCVPYIWGSWLFNRRSVLTGEAFEAVLAGAREGGAEIRTHTGSAAWFGHSPAVYRVRGRDASPMDGPGN